MLVSPWKTTVSQPKKTSAWSSLLWKPQITWILFISAIGSQKLNCRFSRSLQRVNGNRHKKSGVSVMDSQSGSGQKFLKRKMSDPDIHHSLTDVGSPTGTSAPRSAAISIPQHRSSDISPQQSVSVGCEYTYIIFFTHSVGELQDPLMCEYD